MRSFICFAKQISAQKSRFPERRESTFLLKPLIPPECDSTDIPLLIFDLFEQFIYFFIKSMVLTVFPNLSDANIEASLI